MGETSRIIRLRRPPVLSPVEEPFVPRGMSLDEVDERWEGLRARNPAYFDGSLWHVTGVHRNGYGGAVIHVMRCAYRFFAVQRPGVDLGCRPLGVKGFTTRGGLVLAGRRSDSVAGYAGCWEFAPGGSVEPGVMPGEAIAAELREETGLVPSGPPVPMAVFFDPGIRTWEIVYRLEVEDGDVRASPEYTELRWVSMGELPRPRSGVARVMAAMARSLTG